MTITQCANEIAAEMASWVWSEMQHVQRGVTTLDDDMVLVGRDGHEYMPENCTVVFGNDGFLLLNDPRSRREVELLRAKLVDHGLTELGFGLDSDGLTWAMIVLCDDASLLECLVWGAWFRVCDMNVVMAEKCKLSRSVDSGAT